MPAEIEARAGCVNIRVGGFLALIVVVAAVIFYLVHGGSGSAQAGPSCAVTSGGGVVMVVTADHENPNSFCKSVADNQGDLVQEGPWRAGGSPSGSPACTAANAGLTATLYDPRDTGNGANDCTILQQDSWQVTFGQ
jgi:hypothetical protein